MNRGVDKQNTAIIRYLFSLWIMGRPLFLMGIIPLYALGVLAAWHDNKVIFLSLAAAGMGLVWLIQLMTNYNNEYGDIETDQATEIVTRISGGSRALVRGLVPRPTARLAAISCLLLAVILALLMITVMGAGVWLLVFVVIASFLGWFYSAGPLNLESRGLGEAVNVVISCFLVPFTGYYLQSATASSWLPVFCIPLGLLTVSLILATEIPDARADETTGKNTLVVRLGPNKVKWLLVSSLLAGWIIFSVLIIYRLSLWGLISVVVSIPLLAFSRLRMMSPTWQHPLHIEKTGLAISLLVGYSAICLTLSFLAG